MFHKKAFILVNYLTGSPGIMGHKTYNLTYNWILSSRAEAVDTVINKLHIDLYNELNNQKYIITNIQFF